jgi:trehalose 6-phosphate phosphatase
VTISLPAPPTFARDTALFLDFDGTLVALAPRPQDVKVGSWVLPTLQQLQLALDGALALISGRPLVQLDSYLGALRPPAAGVHGMQRRRADGLIRVHPDEPPPGIGLALRALAHRHPALLVETKPGAIALHYRAAPELEAISRATMAAAVAEAPGWSVLQGHAVVEAKPSRVSKASALAAFMAEPPFAGRVPVMVGDDITDEDAIEAAIAAGGYGVIVGLAATHPTRAAYRLGTPHDVGQWLARTLRALADSAP